MKETFVRLSVRQLVYMAIIVALLLPLSMLSQPAGADRQTHAGGQLAQLRAKHKLGDANLGAIDPRSETIRLVSLGLGGIANLILWNQAEEYKEKEDWTGYQVVLDNLINLQPYYPVVWEHQAWNLSYNISAEFDDYHDKYYWVIKGIRFLQEGTTYLEDNPRLLQRTGWFTSHKIGRSDERVQYRRLFRDDDEFHKDQRVQERDNWLFGRRYHQLAEEVVDDGKARLNFMDPVLFHSDAIRAQMFAAEALVSDHQLALEAEANREADLAQRRERVAELDRGYLAQIRGRWSVAEAEMRRFGERGFASESGGDYRLGDLAVTDKLRSEATAQLDAIAPGIRLELENEKRAQLSDKESAALRMDANLRNEEQNRLAQTAQDKLVVTDDEVAARVDPDRRGEAEALAKKIDQLSQRQFRIERSRKQIEYEYWLARCELEQLDDAREAHRHFAHGLTAYKIDTDLTTARREYEAGFAHWRKVLDRYPQLLRDQTAFTVVEAVNRYRQVLRQLDEPFPQQFILADLLEANEG